MNSAEPAEALELPMTSPGLWACDIGIIEGNSLDDVRAFFAVRVQGLKFEDANFREPEVEERHWFYGAPTPGRQAELIDEAVVRGDDEWVAEPGDVKPLKGVHLGSVRFAPWPD